MEPTSEEVKADIDRLKLAVGSVEKLDAQLEAINREFPGAAMGLQNAHLHADALFAVQHASKCELEKTARALAMVGMSIHEVTDVAVRYIEDPQARMRYHDEVHKMLTLTEELVGEALRENCGCRGDNAHS